VAVATAVAADSEIGDLPNLFLAFGPRQLRANQAPVKRSFLDLRLGLRLLDGLAHHQ
jgi:hypothetical protein